MSHSWYLSDNGAVRGRRASGGPALVLDERPLSFCNQYYYFDPRFNASIHHTARSYTDPWKTVTLRPAADHLMHQQTATRKKPLLASSNARSRSSAPLSIPPPSLSLTHGQITLSARSRGSTMDHHQDPLPDQLFSGSALLPNAVTLHQQAMNEQMGLPAVLATIPGATSLTLWKPVNMIPLPSLPLPPAFPPNPHPPLPRSLVPCRRMTPMVPLIEKASKAAKQADGPMTGYGDTLAELGTRGTSMPTSTSTPTVDILH